MEWWPGVSAKDRKDNNPRPVAAFSASSGGRGKAAVQGGAKRLRAGDNTVILGGLLNNRAAFCAGSELPVNFSHGGAHA
jgi:hypothetical protein